MFGSRSGTGDVEYAGMILCADGGDVGFVVEVVGYGVSLLDVAKDVETIVRRFIQLPQFRVTAVRTHSYES